MVGCDTCKEWYHCACVCMAKAQVDKLDTYICIRCSLIHSFDDTATKVAQIINKWMVPDDAIRARDVAISKVCPPLDELFF